MSNRRLYILIICGLIASVQMLPSYSMGWFKRIYWHERVSILSGEAQKYGWLLSDLQKAIANKASFNDKARCCWDILLYVPINKQSIVARDLDDVIYTYNMQRLVNYDDAVKQINNFIQTSIPKHKKQNYIQKLQIQAHNKPIVSYIRPEIIIPACLVGGLGALALVIHVLHKYFIAPKSKQNSNNQQQDNKPITNQNIHESPLLMCDADDLLPLPANIAQLDANKCVIKHIKVAQQSGLTCGWHALFNAQGIDNALKSNNSINVKQLQRNTARAVNNFAGEMRAHMQRTNQTTNEINPHDLRQYACNLGLQNFLSYNIHDKNDDIVHKTSSDEYRYLMMIDEAARIRSTPRGVFYITYNMLSYEHICLIAIIKQPGIPMHMLYMESLNKPLKDNKGGQNIILGLYNSICNPIPYYNEPLKHWKKRNVAVYNDLMKKFTDPMA